MEEMIMQGKCRKEGKRGIMNVTTCLKTRDWQTY